jgi:hypothetical protein
LTWNFEAKLLIGIGAGTGLVGSGMEEMPGFPFIPLLPHTVMPGSSCGNCHAKT